MLTDPQRRALEYLASAVMAAPSQVGQAMMEGRECRAARKGSPQGLGRIGGTMCRRLCDLGLASDASHRRGGFPAYTITSAGRQALRK